VGHQVIELREFCGLERVEALLAQALLGAGRGRDRDVADRLARGRR
jgi:hypothetical protein